MLDIKFIRENLDIVKMAVQRKHTNVDLDHLISLDDSRREIVTRIEEQKAEQNKVSRDISAVHIDPAMKQQLITEMQALKNEIQKDEELLAPIMEEWQALML